MLYYPHICGRFTRFFVSAFGLCLLLCAPRAQAQSVPGFQAPEKGQLTLEVPAKLRAATGQAPLVNLYDYLKVDPSRIERLPPLTASEMRKQLTEKLFRIGVVRPFEHPLDPLA